VQLILALKCVVYNYLIWYTKWSECRSNSKFMGSSL